MTNRLDNITTRTGDDGTSALADGSRHPKSSLRFMAMGDIDELNSHIGLLRAHGVMNMNKATEAINVLLTHIQHHLFEIGSELAVPGMTFLTPNAINLLDEWSAAANATLPALKEFILPGGTLAASQTHICRSVARRAERSLVALNQVEPLSDSAIAYLNRCSDVFFIMARALNQHAKQAETYWRGITKAK